MKFLELYFGAIILWIAAYYVGKILLEEKRRNWLKMIAIIGIFSLILATINMMNPEILGGIIKIIFVYGLECLFYKLAFNESISKVMVVSLIWYLFLFISEIIIILVASILFKGSHDSVSFLKNTIIMNFLISLFDYLLIKVSRNKLVPFARDNDFSRKSSIVMVFVILITLALLVFRIPVKDWGFNIEFIITMIILLCFCLVGLLLLKQKSDIYKTRTMYQQLVDYSDITNELLEDYRIVAHEHKNQLLIISSMIGKDNKELVEYVDNLLDKRTDNKYVWISQLNHIPLSGLKGLINYKLIEMEKLKINIGISISSEIYKTKLKKLSLQQKDNLYSIIGIYLDNAIQAAKESKEKEISLELYKEKKDIVMILANTYTGNLELDKIDNYGYTTKGKNHGVGLHIVKRILEEEKSFSQSRSLFENYYVQELRIHLNQIK